MINGNSFYVTDSSGNTVKVVLSKSSTLTAEKKVGYKTLHPGDTVTIRGPVTGGTVHATSISIGGAGGGFGGFGGRFGDFGGRGGGTGTTGAQGATGGSG